METVTLQGTLAQATTPEGQKATIPIAKLASKIATQRMDTGEMFLPEGVGCVKSSALVTVLVQQIPPQVHAFKWVCGNSAASYGPNMKYRVVRIALPYLVVFVVYAPGENNRI